MSLAEHIPPCSERFARRVFAGGYEDRFLCRCCGRLMPGRKKYFSDVDPLCKRCDRLQNQHTSVQKMKEDVS